MLTDKKIIHKVKVIGFDRLLMLTAERIKKMLIDRLSYNIALKLFQLVLLWAKEEGEKGKGKWSGHWEEVPECILIQI